MNIDFEDSPQEGECDDRLSKCLGRPDGLHYLASFQLNSARESFRHHCNQAIEKLAPILEIPLGASPSGKPSGKPHFAKSLAIALLCARNFVNTHTLKLADQDLPHIHITIKVKLLQ